MEESCSEENDNDCGANDDVDKNIDSESGSGPSQLFDDSSADSNDIFSSTAEEVVIFAANLDPSSLGFNHFDTGGFDNLNMDTSFYFRDFECALIFLVGPHYHSGGY